MGSFKTHSLNNVEGASLFNDIGVHYQIKGGVHYPMKPLTEILNIQLSINIKYTNKDMNKDGIVDFFLRKNRLCLFANKKAITYEY